MNNNLDFWKKIKNYLVKIKGSELLPPYSLEEIEKYEEKMNNKYKLPLDLKDYLLLVSRENIFSEKNYTIDINDINSNINNINNFNKIGIFLVDNRALQFDLWDNNYFDNICSEDECDEVNCPKIHNPFEGLLQIGCSKDDDIQSPFIVVSGNHHGSLWITADGGYYRKAYNNFIEYIKISIKANLNKIPKNILNNQNLLNN
jgi:hypothetical protein